MVPSAVHDKPEFPVFTVRCDSDLFAQSFVHDGKETEDWVFKNDRGGEQNECFDITDDTKGTSGDLHDSRKKLYSYT